MNVSSSSRGIFASPASARPSDWTDKLAGEEPRSGIIRAILYEADRDEVGFRVLRVDSDGKLPMTWVGYSPVVERGARVQGLGREQPDPRRPSEMQFAFSALTPMVPKTVEGIERYLSSGAIKGIGPALAHAIVRVFGTRALDVLDKNPDRLKEVDGIGPGRAVDMADEWRLKRGSGTLLAMLASYGVAGAVATKVLKRYGPRAVSVVQKDPYDLTMNVRGIGFKTADAIAQKNGVDKDAPKRAQAGVMQAFYDAEESDGHTSLSPRMVFARAGELLGIKAELIELAIAQLVTSKHLVVEGASEEQELYLRRTFDTECRVAFDILRLLRSKGRAVQGLDPEKAIAEFETKRGMTFAPAQRAAVLTVVGSKFAVITGGPGVGKTTILLAVLSMLKAAGLKIQLAAPTGRAAKRMQETTGHKGARTIHGLLHPDPKTRLFEFNAKKPIPECDVIIIDESSMIDLALAEDLLQAIPSHARVIVVGDVDQLPAVGAGAVLRDMIDSGVMPTARLTEIFRQAAGSLIITNAHAINNGRVPVTSPSPSGDFFVVDMADPATAIDKLLEMVLVRIPARFGFDPRRDIQILAPMYDGPMGIDAMNLALQAALNPPTGEPMEKVITRKFRGVETAYRVGDKVMVLKNDGERGVYNGDVGFIVDIDDDENDKLIATIQFDDAEHSAVIFKAAEFGGMVRLAYASTIHKFQGSEEQAVIVVLQPANAYMADKKLIYTAVTRGKKLVVLFSPPATLARALSARRKGERRTKLAARLQRMKASLDRMRESAGAGAGAAVPNATATPATMG